MSQQVRIHVDQKVHHAQTPTTGADLYELLEIPDGHVLILEVTGDAEDQRIRIDAAHIDLVEDAHFHTAPAPEHFYLIRVNTDPFIVEHEKVTFTKVVSLAFPTPPGGTDPKFTVTFEHAHSKPHHGELMEGQSVEVKKHGTLFDVAHTNRS